MTSDRYCPLCLGAKAPADTVCVPCAITGRTKPIPTIIPRRKAPK